MNCPYASIMDKTVITNNFSRNALTYDKHASIQRKCARRLIDLIEDGCFFRILEIGCGTGYYTKLLYDKYAGARITASDISSGMVELAKERSIGKDIDFKVFDGEKIELEGSYDLITSNASFQWFERFEQTISSFSKILEPRGALCFSMYGPDTFRELKTVLGECFGGGGLVSSDRFIMLKCVEDVLIKYFKKVRVTEEYFTLEFPSLIDLLKSIKYSGVRGQGLKRNIFLSEERISKMEDVYIKRFGQVTATHHVYFCHAKND